jgi:hypothetical protein
VTETEETWPVRRSEVEQNLRASVLASALFCPGTHSEAHREGLSLTLAALARARQLCEQQQARLVVLCSATKEYTYQDDVVDRIEGGLRQRQDPGWHWRRIEEFCQDQGIECLVLGPGFRQRARAGEQLYFPTDGHWNRQGHALAASLLEAYLREKDRQLGVSQGRSQH